MIKDIYTYGNKDDIWDLIIGSMTESFTGILTPILEAERILTRSTVQKWIANGFSTNIINFKLAEALAGKTTGAFNTLSLIKGELNKFIFGQVDESYFKGAGIEEDTPCLWVSMKDHAVCPDCRARESMGVQPLKYWISIGLPGTGATLCGDHCRCIIVKVGKRVPIERSINQNVLIGPYG